MAGGNASGEPARAGAREQGGTGGEGESVSESQGRASLSEAEAAVRVRQEPAPLQNGVRYRGLAKNADRLALLFGLGNLLTAEGQLSG